MPEDFDDLVDNKTETASSRPGRAADAAKRSSESPGLRSASVRNQPVRKRRAGSKSEDHFYIPEDLLDELRARGLSAEFKRLTYFGKEEEPDYHIALQENGWEPLSLKDFPGFRRLLAKNWTKDTFEKRGQILMVRPQILTDEARAEDRQVAEERVKGHMASLGSSAPGEAPRNNKGNSLVQVRRTYERGVPVE